MKCPRCNRPVSLQRRELASPSSPGSVEEVYVLICFDSACQSASGIWVKDVRTAELVRRVQATEASVRDLHGKIDQLTARLANRGTI